MSTGRDRSEGPGRRLERGLGIRKRQLVKVAKLPAAIRTLAPCHRLHAPLHREAQFPHGSPYRDVRGWLPLAASICRRASAWVSSPT